MKKFLILLVLIFTMGLVACGSSGQEEVETTIDSNQEVTIEAIKELNKVIADDEYVTATLIDVVLKDDEHGKRYNINVEVENKTDETISVTTGEQSIDGMMADELFYYVEDITAGNIAGTMIVIKNSSGDGSLQDVKGNVSFSFDIDIDSEIVSRHDVSIDID